MKWSEIPLIDYIEIYEERCDLYVHTKDKRIIVFKDVQTNAHLNETGLFVDYMSLDRVATGFVPRDDVSHLEYMYSQRPNMDTGIDTLVSQCPPVSLIKPLNDLTDDLI
jgi:hypothetical protein